MSTQSAHHDRIYISLAAAAFLAWAALLVGPSLTHHHSQITPTVDTVSSSSTDTGTLVSAFNCVSVPPNVRADLVKQFGQHPDAYRFFAPRRYAFAVKVTGDKCARLGFAEIDSTNLPDDWAKAQTATATSEAGDAEYGVVKAVSEAGADVYLFTAHRNDDEDVPAASSPPAAESL